MDDPNNPNNPKYVEIVYGLLKAQLGRYRDYRSSISEGSSAPGVGPHITIDEIIPEFRRRTGIRAPLPFIRVAIKTLVQNEDLRVVEPRTLPRPGYSGTHGGVEAWMLARNLPLSIIEQKVQDYLSKHTQAGEQVKSEGGLAGIVRTATT